MTQRNRQPQQRFQSRTRTAQRLWGTTNIASNITQSAITGQLVFNLTTNIEVSLGANLVDSTLLRTRGRFVFRGVEVGSNAFQNVAMGVMWAPSGMDSGDFPDLFLGTGDWPVYQGLGLENHGTALGTDLPYAPPEMFVDSKAMRRQNNNDSDLFLVFQVAASDLDLSVTGVIRCLFLIP